MTLRTIAFIVLLGASMGSAAAQTAREELAPTGKLRVGVYPGSPSSMVRDPKTGETHGVAMEVGQALADRLGVPSELVVYQRVAEVLDGVKAGAVDFTITNATPARARDVAFGPDVLAVELGYLVAADSRIRTIEDVGKPGVRVGVTKGSTSETTLPKLLPNATVTPAPNLKEAAGMLQRGEIDAYATNKAILFEMADRVPGSRVLDGRWGTEHMATAMQQGREKGMEFLRRFSEESRASGVVAKAAERAGMRGLAEK